MVENTVETNAQLNGQRPAGDVVGPIRGTSGIGEIVGMILRLEHIENMSPECLRGFDDVRILLDRFWPLTVNEADAFMTGHDTRLPGGR